MSTRQLKLFIITLLTGVCLRASCGDNDKINANPAKNIKKLKTGENGLLGHWDFNEGEGNVAHDLAGGIGDLMTCGNPKWVKNKSGYCMKFDGTPKRKVYAATTENLGRGFHGLLSSGTFSVWAKAIGNGVVYKNDKQKRTRLISLSTVLAGTLHGAWCGVVVDGAGVEYMTGPSVDNEWTHVVITWNPVFRRFYVNGKEYKKPGGPYLTRGCTAHDSRFPLYVGSAFPDWGQAFYGYLDELKFFNRMLSNQEIVKLYTAEKMDRTIE